jgi:fumarylacetoacetase
MYGIDGSGHVVALRDEEVVDLSLLPKLPGGREVWTSGSLDALFGLGPDAWAATAAELRSCEVPKAARRPIGAMRLLMPWTVRDYADFYCSREHVERMGRTLRPTSVPVPPAWVHAPMGYHGRAGTVVVSGTPVRRPSGMLAAGKYGPTNKLDVEVEVGFVVGVAVPRGRVVSAEEAERHLFGAVIVADWSARDIQAFQSFPLGPFAGKSFLTSVSPWVVPMAELARWRVPGPVQEPEPHPHLKASEPRGLDIGFELRINGSVVSRVNAAGLYWSPGQMLAHYCSNGAGARPGDLLASGTISGPGVAECGCLAEMGTDRWLADGDTVEIVSEVLGSLSSRVMAQ